MTTNYEMQEYYENSERQVLNSLPPNYFYKATERSSSSQLITSIDSKFGFPTFNQKILPNTYQTDSTTVALPVNYDSRNDFIIPTAETARSYENYPSAFNQQNQSSNMPHLNSHTTSHSQMDKARHAVFSQIRDKPVQNPVVYNTQCISNNVSQDTMSFTSIHSTMQSSSKSSTTQEKRLNNIQILNVENVGNCFHDEIAKYGNYKIGNEGIPIPINKQIGVNKPIAQEVRNISSNPNDSWPTYGLFNQMILERPSRYNKTNTYTHNGQPNMLALHNLHNHENRSLNSDRIRNFNNGNYEKTPSHLMMSQQNQRNPQTNQMNQLDQMIISKPLESSTNVIRQGNLTKPSVSHSHDLTRHIRATNPTHFDLRPPNSTPVYFQNSSAPSPFLPICASTPYYSGPATPRIFPSFQFTNHHVSSAIISSKPNNIPAVKNKSASTSSKICNSRMIQHQPSPAVTQSASNCASTQLDLSSDSSLFIQNDPLTTSEQIRSSNQINSETAIPSANPMKQAGSSRYYAPPTLDRYGPSSLSTHQNINVPINSPAEFTFSQQLGLSKDNEYEQIILTKPSGSSNINTNEPLSNDNTKNISNSPAQSIISLSSESSNDDTSNFSASLSKTYQNLKCQRCHRFFRTSCIFERHDCRSTVCGFCQNNFETREKMFNHMRRKHLSALWRINDRCEICGNTYALSSFICAHKKVNFFVPISNIFICDLDGRLFYRKSNIQSHIDGHLPKIKCELCPAELKRSSIRTHLKEFHATERKFVCGICDSAFKSASVLREHMNRHNKKYECKICDRKFSRKYKFLEHHRFKHDENAEPIICRVCGKRISTKESLKKHLIIHDKSIPN